MGVSVVMAVYNAAAYVGEAIDSVLGQSSPPEELIIVDDGSTDDTSQILDRYSSRIKRLSQENGGQFAALTRAIAAARGEMLAFQDADDIWCQRKLELQIRVLENNAHLDAVFCLIRQFVSPDVPEAMKTKIGPVNETLRGEIQTGLLIRRTAFERVGSFDPAFGAAGFIEWLGRAKRLRLQSRMIHEVLALRRLHLNNYGRLHSDLRNAETLLALRHIVTGRKRPE
jgi:glycosyltransferase involved in cell wall biosynthesis